VDCFRNYINVLFAEQYKKSYQWRFALQLKLKKRKENKTISHQFCDK
jgi:hypothetical protein